MITVGVVCVKVRGLWSVQSTHRGLFVWSIGNGGVVGSPFGYRTQAIVSLPMFHDAFWTLFGRFLNKWCPGHP
jgi:hypothetical protein